MTYKRESNLHHEQSSKANTPLLSTNLENTISSIKTLIHSLIKRLKARSSWTLSASACQRNVILFCCCHYGDSLCVACQRIIIMNRVHRRRADFPCWLSITVTRRCSRDQITSLAKYRSDSVLTNAKNTHLHGLYRRDTDDKKRQTTYKRLWTRNDPHAAKWIKSSVLRINTCRFICSFNTRRCASPLYGFTMNLLHRDIWRLFVWRHQQLCSD